MAELEIRPTMKFILVGYAVTIVLVLGALAWWNANQRDPAYLGVVGVAMLLLLWPASKHLQRQRIRCRLDGDQFRYEVGLISTSVKTLLMSRIQDVTVRRSVVQRMFGIGDLRIETAGQSSALEIDNIDNPQAVADRILSAAAPSKGRPASG
jgi:uncharacterized membrane protein YdbT with pleckstrin-like domain